MRRTSRLVVAGAVVLLLLAGGCGSSGRTRAPQARPSVDASSPSPSVEPTTASPTPPPTGDLSLAFVKRPNKPSCYIVWAVKEEVYGGPAISGFRLGISFELRGLAPFGKATATITTSAGDSWPVNYIDPTDTSYTVMELISDKRYFGGPVTITITADPQNVLKETNERNNVLKARLTLLRRSAPKSESDSRCTQIS